MMTDSSQQDEEVREEELGLELEELLVVSGEEDAVS